MRVFYFLTKSEVGGAQTVVTELLAAHQGRGDSVVVMAQGNGWLAGEVRRLGGEYVENRWMKKTYNPLTIIQAALQYRRSVRRVNPDIISIHNSFSGIIGRLFRIKDIPIVYTAHGWGFAYGSRIMKYPGLLLEKIATHFCEAVVCVAQSDMRIARAYKIAPLSKLHLIHNGVAVGEFARSRSDIPSIVFVGRFAHPKQQALFVTACTLLPESLKKVVHISFVGNGPLEQSVRVQATARGLANVRFLGACSREEGLGVVAQSWVSVLLSQSEGFPMSLIESLQLGVPVVASDVGGVREIVTDNVGILVPRDAVPRQIAAALEQVLTNKALLDRMSTEAKTHGQLFSVSYMSTNVFALYESLT